MREINNNLQNHTHKYVTLTAQGTNGTEIEYDTNTDLTAYSSFLIIGYKGITIYGSVEYPAADMIGFEQGRLKVVRRAGNKGGKALWECQCQCGELCKYTTTQLRYFGVQSCGCLQREKAAELAPSAGKKRIIKNGSCKNAFDAKIGKNNTSGIKGVSYHKKAGKWRAQIRVQGKNYYLGIYERIEDAVAAREKAEEQVKKWFEEK